METKANYSIVGFFILLVLAAAAGFIYWMGEYGRQGPIAELVVRIPGSANGLSVGSAVRFNGIQVGSIRKLEIDPADPRYTIARTEVKADTPVHDTTKAKLELQGLTGTGYIELSANGQDGPNILQQALEDDKPAELTADKSSLSNLLATADQIMQRIDSTVTDVQNIVSDVRSPLTDTISNIDTFTKALADNSDGIGKFLASVGDLSDTVVSLTQKLDQTISTIDGVVAAINPEDIKNIVANANRITDNVANASGNFDEIAANLNSAVETYAGFAKKAQDALDKVDTIISSVDAAKVGSSVDDFSATMADARAAVQSIKEVADSVNARTENIDTAIDNVSEIATKLNDASTRVNTILVKVDKLLGSDNVNSLSDQARDTLAAVKDAAETLQARIGPITANLEEFSGSGLRDVRGLVSDTRRTVDTLNRTIESLSQDPQQLLFGPEGVKTYDGRNRY
ncbi:MlaD family protein [Martelella endophytica]|uniref:Organic solvent ABC transporter substrate-binding protein n=1 Tax=Martelella endophytica TaxID=1486262 RepID=A0A0D5LSE8_MAREN|nr:MlaD family protein [Martelella endophytica]AJY46707.1 organic solvent ABC transporter substrate-binding protein [Martelella endophytica]